jgi:hypothetical protein
MTTFESVNSMNNERTMQAWIVMVIAIGLAIMGIIGALTDRPAPNPPCPCPCPPAPQPAPQPNDDVCVHGCLATAHLASQEWAAPPTFTDSKGISRKLGRIPPSMSHPDRDVFLYDQASGDILYRVVMTNQQFDDSGPYMDNGKPVNLHGKPLGMIDGWSVESFEVHKIARSTEQ